MSEDIEKRNIALKLNDLLIQYISELKEYHQIQNNTDMVRNCITIAYRAMLKEKKELGLDKGMFE